MFSKKTEKYVIGTYNMSFESDMGILNKKSIKTGVLANDMNIEKRMY